MAGEAGKEAVNAAIGGAQGGAQGEAQPTLLTGTIIKEMRAARVRFEKLGLTEKEIKKKLKAFYFELVSGKMGMSQYYKDPTLIEAGLDAGSEY